MHPPSNEVVDQKRSLLFGSGGHFGGGLECSQFESFDFQFVSEINSSGLQEVSFPGISGYSVDMLH